MCPWAPHGSELIRSRGDADAYVSIERNISVLRRRAAFTAYVSLDAKPTTG